MPRSIRCRGKRSRTRRCRRSCIATSISRRLLPLPTHNEHDNGPYITAGLLIARNPATGVQNVSIHRLQLSGPNRLGALLLPRHTHMFYDMAERAGQPLDVAIVIGVDPLTLLSSQAIAPLDFDELTIAGALARRAAARGEMRHQRRARAGRRRDRDRRPHAAAGARDGRSVRRIPAILRRARPSATSSRSTAVTQRKDAIFHTIVGGGLEHLLLGGIPREATLLAHLRRSFPDVRDVHLARGGVCRYHLYVQIAKRQEGEAKNVMMGAFAGHYDVKQVVVVDEDVDIHDPAEVEWAVATRFQADRDLVIVPESQGSKLDPSTRDGVGAKMGLDATKPLDADEMKFKRIRVPGEEEVDLAKVIGDLGGKEPTAQGAVRHESNPKPTHRIEQLTFGVARPKRILRLKSSDGIHLLRLSNGVRRGFR